MWDRSTGAPINCFCLFVYSCCFPPCKICVRDTGIKGTICLWNAKSRDLESVILLEESEILLMIGICTLTAMVMVFRSRCSNFWPYRLKIWPRLWRSNFWPVLLTDLLNARMFNRSKFVLHLSGAMWTKFASKPSPQKFSLSKVYNSLNFSTKYIEIPHCC